MPRKPRTIITPLLQLRVVKLSEQGRRREEIATELGLSLSAVRTIQVARGIEFTGFTKRFPAKSTRKEGDRGVPQQPKESPR